MTIYSIILDFNNPKDTFLAYKSLIAQKLDENIEHRIIVVDNGSSKENQKINRNNFNAEDFIVLDNTFSNIEYSRYNILIILDENLGFTGGNNIAFDISLKNKADYILLFNNDAIAETDTISKLISYSGGESITGGTIYDYENHNIIQTLGTYTFGWKGYSSVPHKLITEEKIQVASVSGACMLLPAKILNEIGLFDDNFYLYSEENELSKRALIAGYNSYTIPSAKVYHKGSATLGNESDLKFYYLIRNNIYFHKKHSTKVHYIFIIFYQLGINVIKKFSSISKLKTLFYSVYDGMTGNMGKCKRTFI